MRWSAVSSTVSFSPTDRPLSGATSRRVVLVHLPGQPSVAYDGPYESLRLGSVSASLRASGFDVDMVDVALTRCDEAQTIGATLGAHLVVVDALYRTLEDATRFAHLVHQRHGCDVILLGEAAAASARHVLESARGAIAAVVIGTPEQVVLGLARRDSRDDAVPGAAIRRSDGSIRVTRSEHPVAAPRPDRPYLANAAAAGGVLEVETSRGCASRCSFCTVGSAGRLEGGARRGWLPRPVTDIVDEIRSLAERTGVRRFHFSDDNALGNRRLGRHRAMELADGLAPLGISFSFYCRADAVEPDTFQRLRSAGLCQVHLGVEAGDDRTLARLAKDQSRQHVGRAVALLRSLQVRVVPSFIFFEPRQSLDELAQSVAWTRANGLEDGFSATGAIPLPGTLLLDELEAEGLVDRVEGPEQALLPVRFIDERVAQVLENVHRLEKEVARTAAARPDELAAAYHSYNNRLDVADALPTPATVRAHERWRKYELGAVADLVCSVAGRREGTSSAGVDELLDHHARGAQAAIDRALRATKAP